MDKLETSPASQFCDTVDVDKFAVKAVRKKKFSGGRAVNVSPSERTAR